MADPSWDEGGAEAKAFAARNLGAGSKWDGEDEDDDVIESWEDFDEDKPENQSGDKSGTASTETKAPTKKKRNLKDIIAEKEDKKRKEFEEKRQKELTEKLNLSPEDAFAEKLRQQKLQEDADLQLAKEAFGLKNDVDSGAFESMNPSNKEEFDNYRRLLVDIVNKHEKSGFYLSFLEDLFRDLCVNMDADDVKKLSSTLNALGNEKVKAAKVAKGGKKKSKKATLVVGRPGDFVYDEFQGGDEYDDFM